MILGINSLDLSTNSGLVVAVGYLGDLEQFYKNFITYGNLPTYVPIRNGDRRVLQDGENDCLYVQFGI